MTRRGKDKKKLICVAWNQKNCTFESMQTNNINTIFNARPKVDYVLLVCKLSKQHKTLAFPCRGFCFLSISNLFFLNTGAPKVKASNEDILYLSNIETNLPNKNHFKIGLDIRLSGFLLRYLFEHYKPAKLDLWGGLFVGRCPMRYGLKGETFNSFFSISKTKKNFPHKKGLIFLILSN